MTNSRGNSSVRPSLSLHTRLRSSNSDWWAADYPGGGSTSYTEQRRSSLGSTYVVLGVRHVYVGPRRTFRSTE